MTTRTAQGTLWVCTDCMFSCELGAASDDPDYTPDREPWNIEPDTDVTIGLTWAEHEDPVACELMFHDGIDKCDCERMEFSWRSCDACGSTLAGSRHAYTWWA